METAILIHKEKNEQPQAYQNGNSHRHRSFFRGGEQKIYFGVMQIAIQPISRILYLRPGKLFIEERP